MGGRPVLTRAAGEWARPRPQPQPAGGSPVGCLDRPGPTSPACFRASCVLRAPGQAAWFDVQWLSASRALLRAAASEMETCPVVPTSLIITDQGTAPPRPRGCTALSRAWPTAASLGTPNKVGVTGTWLHIIPHPSPSPLEVRVCWPPRGLVWSSEAIGAAGRPAQPCLRLQAQPGLAWEASRPSGAHLVSRDQPRHSQPPFSREGSSSSPPAPVPGLKPNPVPAAPCPADAGGCPWRRTREQFC